MKFYKIGSSKEFMRVIYARNSYEAAGDYLLETNHNCTDLNELFIQITGLSEHIQVLYNGYPFTKSLQEISKEKRFTTCPCTVVEILN
ncbi:hypothetical protein BW897_29170 [Bacillus cereus]|uniref:Uncharacterized protein n=1 Tax=Bacillus cereus TaxID=1396 RepID=A0A1S9TGM6_BACCE|nr:hypothetical protein [Bacillus cereus]OOR09195.1 hypothetical protein BW897_29170 [Bacillus cereus]